ncbi:MAG TPA: HPr(Ser) kinase/phosphatase [Verrucomicrobiales bacterium]|jgi:HPr kinase/phosphorylase|nr:HPr(Ser) kinase/phosphatase [Verrucomicrobiales bacterium]
MNESAPAVIESKSKIRQIKHLSVGEFVDRHSGHLHLEPEGRNTGRERKISEPSINRPGLALAGFYLYFAYKRIQVIGNSEFAYLNSLSDAAQRKAFRAMCQSDIPCLVTCRGRHLPPDMVDIADEAGVSVYRTTMNTMKFINSCTLWLEWEFAPIASEHGCMVDVKGIGVLIKGESGVGKSEAVLGLLERGASLVADDKVRFRAPESRELTGTAEELGRFHLEVRGLGIVNVPLLFGVASMRVEKRLDLVVHLKPMEKFVEVDRLGTDQRYYRLMGVNVPYAEIPVAPGRDVARMVEVAALEHKLRSFGHHSAVEFNKKLLQHMEEKRIS